jgi:hypothetical protein
MFVTLSANGFWNRLSLCSVFFKMAANALIFGSCSLAFVDHGLIGSNNSETAANLVANAHRSPITQIDYRCGASPNDPAHLPGPHRGAIESPETMLRAGSGAAPGSAWLQSSATVSVDTCTPAASSNDRNSASARSACSCGRGPTTFRAATV